MRYCVQVHKELYEKIMHQKERYTYLDRVNDGVLKCEHLINLIENTYKLASRHIQRYC